MLAPLALLSIGVGVRLRCGRLSPLGHRSLVMLGVSVLNVLLLGIGWLVLMTTPFESFQAIGAWLGR